MQFKCAHRQWRLLSPNYILMPGLLASGEISIGVSYTTDLPANAKRKVLRRSKPMLLRADSMPGSMSLDDFCARPHARSDEFGVMPGGAVAL